MFGPCFVVLFEVSIQFCIYLAMEERAKCFALINFLMSCGC